MAKRICASYSEPRPQGSLDADIAQKRRRAGGGYVDRSVWLQRIVVGHQDGAAASACRAAEFDAGEGKAGSDDGRDRGAWCDAGRDVECDPGRGDLNGGPGGSEAVQAADVEPAYG